MMEQSLRHRPIYGGVFGAGRYALATMPCISRGLHRLRFLVIEPREGRVLSIEDDRGRALSAARRLLKAAGILSRSDAREQSDEAQAVLWPELCVAREGRQHRARPRQVPRRRREIFERSQGRCHYCSTPLALDGEWHCEHQVARALGGGNEIGNLVASCPTCNLAKRDRTALEFVVEASHASE